MYDLVHGDVLAAAGHNLLLLPALAWLAWWWIAAVCNAIGLRAVGPPQSSRFAAWLLAVIIVFTLARNIPGSPLAP